MTNTNRYTYNGKGHRNPYITEEQLLKVVGDNSDQGTYEYAKELNETSQIVLRALERAEKRGLIQRRVVCRNMPLWSLTGKQRCSVCDAFLEYTGVEWACSGCQKELFEDDEVLSCFKQFSPDSIQCKMCCIAVECYEASQ